MSDQVEAVAVKTEAPTVETVEVHDTPAPKVDQKPSRDEVINQRGWTAEEADKAEKRGMLRKPETPQEKKSTEVPKTEEKPPMVERRKMADHEFEMTPEQEEAFHKIFPAGTKPSAFFTTAKIERIKRQEAARRAEQFQKERDDLKAKLEAYEKQQKAQPVVDENGNEIDPDERPLTMKQIREMQRQAEEERQQRERELSERSTSVAQAHKEQEEMARAMFEDFDDSLKLAGELATKLEDIITDPIDLKLARKLMTEFHSAAQNADKLGPNDLNAAELAYKLGRLHPNFGKTTTTNGKQADGISPESDPKQKDGTFTPEQLKRLEANTQRRASSASIPGGSGTKAVTAEEVTVEQLNRMKPEQRIRFRQKYPETYSKLLRG